jgi:GON domain/EGF domain
VRPILLLTALVGCTFQRDVAPNIDAMVDAELPIMCGVLTCDPHAVCMESSAGASCACATGYAGDGMTCTAIDVCATNNGGCPAACETTGPGTHACYTPRTCAEVAQHQTLPDNTAVTLYAGGDATRPWTAYCHAGLEYLTAASATSNFGQYSAGGKSPGMSVRTTYARLRIDPTTLAIDICDRTFATTTGALSHDPAFHDPDIAVTSMPLGIAMDCAAINSQSGTAGINLTSTPFVVSSNWTRAGNDTAGSANKMMNGRTVSITGGGSCGWNAPNGAPNDPFNACTSLKLITLQYAP